MSAHIRRYPRGLCLEQTDLNICVEVLRSRNARRIEQVAVTRKINKHINIFLFKLLEVTFTYLKSNDVVDECVPNTILNN